jgi:hypothetical protein
VHRIDIAADVAVLTYPLRGFAIDFGRNVTLLRLRDRRVLIHSTAPFAPEDVNTIREFGIAGWLVEATMFHDTFAKAGHGAFPDLPYLAPAGFAKVSGIPTELLSSPPADWTGEISVLQIEGLRFNHEHAFYHHASRTVVLADLLFHFPPETAGWARFFVQKVMRLPRLVGISIFFRFMIRDKERFAQSMRDLLRWDFRQIVVAHREPITADARSVFVRALRERGVAVDG